MENDGKKTKERICLGWCGKTFVPEKNEHFCKACDKKRRSLREPDYDHGKRAKSSFKSPPFP